MAYQYKEEVEASVVSPTLSTRWALYIDSVTKQLRKRSSAGAVSDVTCGSLWGGITGTLANQTDLQAALDAKDTGLTIGTKSSNIASASTTDLSTATGAFAHVTGTTTITAFGTVTAGRYRHLVFDGALTLTHNATSLILPSGANIVTTANDCAVMVSEGSGNWRCVSYIRASGVALATSVDAMQYKGAWNASTNTPTLINGTGNDGDMYRVSVAGTRDLGAGSQTYNISDSVVYNATTTQWDFFDNTQAAITSGDVTTALGYTPQRTFPVLTAMGNQSGSINVDLSLGEFFTITATGNLTIAFTNGPSSGYGAKATLIITQDGTGGRTVTITSAIYPNGIAYLATSTASAKDIVGILINGTTGTINAFPVENMA